LRGLLLWGLILVLVLVVVIVIVSLSWRVVHVRGHAPERIIRRRIAQAGRRGRVGVVVVWHVRSHRWGCRRRVVQVGGRGWMCRRRRRRDWY